MLKRIETKSLEQVSADRKNCSSACTCNCSNMQPLELQSTNCPLLEPRHFQFLRRKLDRVRRTLSMCIQCIIPLQNIFLNDRLDFGPLQLHEHKRFHVKWADQLDFRRDFYFAGEILGCFYSRFSAPWFAFNWFQASYSLPLIVPSKISSVPSVAKQNSRLFQRCPLFRLAWGFVVHATNGFWVECLNIFWPHASSNGRAHAGPMFDFQILSGQKHFTFGSHYTSIQHLPSYQPGH